MSSKKIHFLLSRLSVSEKLGLLFLFLSLVSLFFPWLILGNSEHGIHKINSFSPIIGNIGFFLSVLIIGTIAKVVKYNNTSLLPIPKAFQPETSQLIFWGSIILLFSSLHSYLAIRGLSYFDSSINHSFGLILSITSSIMLLGISFIMQNEKKHSQAGGSFIGEKSLAGVETRHQKEENMKLPV